MDDEAMDRLLRRAAEAPAGPGAAACLDSETLAAFIDGGLSPAQRAAAEAHLAGCDRCLQLTAAIIRAEPPPLETPRWSWLRSGWLAPLTTVSAVAVAVAAWLMVRDTQPTIDAVRRETPAASAASEPSAPVLPSETSKAAVPEFRQESAARTDAVAKRRAPGEQAAERRAAAEPKAEADAVTRSAPPASAAPARPPSPTDDLAREGLTALRQMAAEMTVVPTPDPAVQWRFSPSVLESTGDGGRTWTPHAPGASGFLAAAAPSPGVLWLAGRAGLVLLTIDGRTWQRVNLPDTTADAVQVTATDGRSARVTTSAGSTYRTTDAGRTWVLQEIHAGAF